MASELSVCLSVIRHLWAGSSAIAHRSGDHIRRAYSSQLCAVSELPGSRIPHQSAPAFVACCVATPSPLSTSAGCFIAPARYGPALPRRPARRILLDLDGKYGGSRF